MAAPTDRPAAEYDAALLRFVEQLAVLHEQLGMPRMPARVFSYILAEDRESYTAAELAAGLGVSTAAISVAVRNLLRAGMIARERRPGTRTDHYRVYDEDVWSAILRQRRPLLQRMEAVLADGLTMLDPARPGGHRIHETLEFYRFLQAESERVAERWQEYRRTHLDQHQ